MVDGRQRVPGRATFRERAVRATRVVDGASGLAGPRGQGVTVAAGRPRARARHRGLHGSGGRRRLPLTVGRELIRPAAASVRMFSEEGPDIEVLDAVVAVVKMLSGALAQCAADDPV